MNNRLSDAGSRKAGSDPTRTIAFDVLVAVTERRRTIEEALDHADPARPSGMAGAQVPSRDRAAAHRLAATVLRRMGTLEAVLEPFLAKAPPPRVKLALMMGAAQLLFLETPPHAAVGTVVSLMRERSLAPFAGLVNAVLRKVAGAGVAALDALDGPRLDVPAWLWSSWGGLARQIAEGLAREAPLDLTLRPGGATPEGGVLLPTGSVRLPAGTRVAELDGYAEGGFWVQDAAAAIPARLLAPQAGERIADLCAAPGGKTAQLASAGAQVFAVERDGNRLRRLRQNLTRLQLEAEIVEADALVWTPPELLDAILLDAPCSATGTARRHPDVLRLKRQSDIAGLVEGQDRLIEAAARMLRPGGRVVYAVCSLQPEEGDRRAEAAHRFGLSLEPFTTQELAALPEARTPEGWLRTHPGLWPELGGMDGFFAARFVRR
ncbi:rRNA cytosine-C5-methylase [Lichenicola cladoniae]|uniref:rRNA cytosine-C5-methylase n=1 Tax=Lichenicola cladoniae TaxID=1484109 RepID=A0A6M8HVC3_9PROT|nr:transcription antitermination factor NusB [Lichenicola cladoniae]NPD69522.1 rRNA cytosine-C5-methylase [Acetobacteraceae bacterium]QKE92115.1 rRNA cytosine-C5-methylase [Lichenicola cladoniae]